MSIKGDFISFTYNGVHSTQLGVVHVTSSNRYTDALLPTIQDKTVQVPGGDGTYFFGSYYTQRQITLNIAFDEVTEDQIRLMRKTFGDKQTHQLIFDEEPYKIYYAKVTGTPQLQYIPFSSPRVYKGEGTYTFTCYEPFAHCPNNRKYLSQYTVGNPSYYKYNNKDEWNLSANLLSQKGDFDTWNPNAARIKIYNPGDLETDFKFTISLGAGMTGIKITRAGEDLESHTLMFANLKGKGKPTSLGTVDADTAVRFNSKLNIIEGIVSNTVPTGNIYNEYIESGEWFKIPVINDPTEEWYFEVINYEAPSEGAPFLQYDYLYF